MPEIKEIYSAIKNIGFSSRIVDAEKKWKTAALNRFDDSKKGFEFIKREYLEDDDIYRFTSGQERRDFEGKVLQIILRDRSLGKHGAQFLRNLYKGIIDRLK